MNKESTFKKNEKTLPFPINSNKFSLFVPPSSPKRICHSFHFSITKGLPVSRKPFLHYLVLPNRLLTLSQKLPPSDSPLESLELELELEPEDWFCSCSSRVITLLPPDSPSEVELLLSSSSDSGSAVVVEEERWRIQLDGI